MVVVDLKKNMFTKTHLYWVSAKQENTDNLLHEVKRFTRIQLALLCKPHATRLCKCIRKPVRNMAKSVNK